MRRKYVPFLFFSRIIRLLKEVCSVPGKYIYFLLNYVLYSQYASFESRLGLVIAMPQF